MNESPKNEIQRERREISPTNKNQTYACNNYIYSFSIAWEPQTLFVFAVALFIYICIYKVSNL
jgi:hypothetical protein